MPPQVIEIVKGLGAASNTFISPVDEFCAVDAFEIEVSETVTLTGQTVDVSGGVAPSVDALVGGSAGPNGGVLYTVDLSAGIPVGEWAKFTLNLRSVATQIDWALVMWVGHLPDDVDQNGTVDMADSTAFGDEFNGLKRPELIDINCDGVVNVQDATAFGDNYNGLNGRQVWNGRSLPSMP